MNKFFLSVIIPTYNNAKQLALILIDIDKFLRETDFEYEILAVDAKSTDQTVDLIRRFSALVKNLKLIPSEPSASLGNALRKGVEEARGEVCLALSPEGNYPVESLSKMLSSITDDKSLKKSDVIIGVRPVKNKDIDFISRFNFFLAQFLGRQILKLKFKDLFSGIYGFQKETAQAVFSKTKLFGFESIIEAVYLSETIGLKIKEVGLPAKSGEEFSPQVLARNFWPILKIRYLAGRNIYNLQNKN